MNFEFKHLFTPLDVGPLTLRNRIYVTPHATMFASDNRNNLPGERLAYYCAERVKGGAALIEVSMGIVSLTGGASGVLAATSDSHFAHMMGGHPMVLSGRWPINASDPKVVEGYSKLAKKVHEYGGRCFIELDTGGTNTGGLEGISSFPYPSTTNFYTMPSFTPREMDEKKLSDLAEAFGKAAEYVRDSGLDGVDIHASHGGLITESLSSVMNRRQDKYGGSLENRTRFLNEIVQRTREHVGEQIAVGMRLFADSEKRGGNTIEDTTEIARRLDGKIDWVTVDQGIYPQNDDWQAVPMYVETGYNERLSNPVKSALKKTKVGVVGRYVDPVYAETLLSKGLADMVAMTRAMIADPELPNKARDGRLEDIRPCIGGLQDCWGRMNRGLPISCTVNPSVSREKEWGIGTIKKAETRKKVLIIGGGPAGLETARVAAQRGHDVVIYEKSRQLGGQALFAGRLPGRENLKAIVTWLTEQISKLGVEVKYGLEITPDPEVIQFVLDSEKPDAVVVATGALPIRSGYQPYNFKEIEGSDQPNVYTEVDVLTQSLDLGKEIIVADTLGFIEAPGIGEFLAKQGKSVQIISYHPNLAAELKLINHWEHLFPRLISAGIKITSSTWISRIDGRNVHLYDVFFPEKRWVALADNVILVTGKMQNDVLYGSFNGKVKETYLVGDANLGGARLGNAFYDAQSIGRLL